MALLKYGSNLIKTGGSLLKYIDPIPTEYYGYWKHYDTGVITSFAEWYPDYSYQEGPPEVVTFDGYSEDGIGQYAELVSEIKFKEGCTVVENIGKHFDQDREVTLYEHLQVLDFPSTLENLGAGNSIFGGLDQITTIIFRSVTPPTIILGNIQSPQAMIYVPDGSVNTYKSAPTWSTFASIIFPLSDIE